MFCFARCLLVVLFAVNAHVTVRSICRGKYVDYLLYNPFLRDKNSDIVDEVLNM